MADGAPPLGLIAGEECGLQGVNFSIGQPHAWQYAATPRFAGYPQVAIEFPTL
jgi:hypothetical protein